MLKKNNRLTKDEQYQETIKEGKSFHSKHIKWFVNLKKKSRRVGIVVSNKVSGKATRRNRIKRIIRSWLQNNLEGLPKAWQVVMVKSDSQDEQIKKELEKLAQKIKS